MKQKQDLLRLVAEGVTTPDAIDSELEAITIDDDSSELIHYTFDSTTGDIIYEYLGHGYDYSEVDEGFYEYLIARINNVTSKCEQS